MRTMYDSTDPGDIPVSAEMVAGYINGRYAWPADAWGKWPVAVTISIDAGTDADVLDVEGGNAWPGEVPGWLARHQGPYPGTVYCSLDAWGQVRGIVPQGTPVAYWIAHWTGSPHELDGAAAVQYANPALSGGHFDLSAVYDDGWFPAPSEPPTPPVPGPAPDPVEVAVSSFPVLSPGASGLDVKKVQALLAAFGYTIVIDGVYGPNTETTVRQFQTAHRITVDGIAGPETVSHLISDGEM